ncbi:alpha/beta fold hydrolase [Streptodolium elevatio]|uniref:Alpha/beta hydrolase n=1 Tax=Streptodolium elevatio TaxID=3157996 RepID=A0ABV3DP35_9ACTN
MPTFPAPDDGSRLAYRADGDGEPLICLPGGPSASAYLGDLGGLTVHRRLTALDLRGTGGSARPEDPDAYRCDRLVDDVEAFRAHLGLAQIDLLGHSGGVNLAVLYAVRHPERVRRLVLVGPSTRAVGVDITGEMRRGVAQLRVREAWFAEAYAALDVLLSGGDADWDAITPFLHGRWDDEARAFHAASQPDNDDAVRMYGAEGVFDPAATRAALKTCSAPVLLLVGEYDLNSPPPSTEEFADLFPHAEVVVQPGAGHYPWRDDPARFTATVADFLG